MKISENLNHKQKNLIFYFSDLSRNLQCVFIMKLELLSASNFLVHLVRLARRGVSEAQLARQDIAPHYHY